jgi:DNA-binding response OmpR family regulator
LAVAVGKPVTSTEIVASRPIKYNEMEAFALDRLGKVTVAHLREILGEDMIKTVWGQGYIATELCINAVAEACKYIL